jgi:4-carboxymuconolactone decarboxylase
LAALKVPLSQTFMVNFSQDCTMGWHTHNCDQVLVVTSGSGTVATEPEEREINVGDVVHIKAGERHWYGAKAVRRWGHITITVVGSQASHG